MAKKIEIYPNNEVAYIVPPEPIDENEPICLADYFIPQSDEKLFNYDRMRRFGNPFLRLHRNLHRNYFLMGLAHLGCTVFR